MSVITALTRILIFTHGTICPAYRTYKVIAEQRHDEFYDWSKYWIVYALLVCTEMITDIVLSWLPLYTLSKLLLVLFMVYSAPQVSIWVYDSIVDPLLSGRQRQIDHFLDHDKEHLLSTVYACCIGLLVTGKQLATISVLKLWTTSNEVGSNINSGGSGRQLREIDQSTDQPLEQNTDECDTHIKSELPMTDDALEGREHSTENDTYPRMSNFNLAHDMKMLQNSPLVCPKRAMEKKLRSFSNMSLCNKRAPIIPVIYMDVPAFPSENESETEQGDLPSMATKERNGIELQSMQPPAAPRKN